MTPTNELFSHLSASAKMAMDLSTEERINKMKQERWIGYTEAKRILDKFEDLLAFPPRHRMPCLLLVGDTNNGKTMIARRFLQLHEPDLNLDGDAIIAPVLLVQAPPVPDEGRFYDNIFHRLAAPFKVSERVPRKQAQIIKLLSSIQLRVLIIDEIHDILAGSLRKQQEFLNVIKYLSNELMISIIGVGTRDALRAIQTDPQIANRFEPVILPTWSMNQDFLRLLASFEKVLPLHFASGLPQSELANKLYSMCEGYIGELSRVLTMAAIEAVVSGEEKVTLALLERLSWVKPSERRRAAERTF